MNKRRYLICTKYRSKKDMKKDDEERELENLVFGNWYADNNVKIENHEKSSESNNSLSCVSKKQKKLPAWIDQDDDQILMRDVKRPYKQTKSRYGAKQKKYCDFVSEKFYSMHKNPQWAEPSNTENVSDEEILQTVITSNETTRAFKHNRLIFSSCWPLNGRNKCEGNIINAVEFHPRTPIALVGGLSGNLSLYHVDGKKNSSMYKFKFDKFPIHCAHFTSDGSRILVGSSMVKYFHCIDLATTKTMQILSNQCPDMYNMNKFIISPSGDILAVQGKFGSIHILSANCFELLDTLQISGNVGDFAFSPDGSILYTISLEGEIHLWDMRKMICFKKFSDEGCFKGCSIAVSPCHKFIATSSSVGIVNFYSKENEDFSLKKSFMNLVTLVNTLAFNSDSRILSIGSQEKENAVRLVNISSLSVFSNFPTPNIKFGKIQKMTFSPNSGYLAMSNYFGAVHLLRLHHYSNY